jgi:hypothetical protein
MGRSPTGLSRAALRSGRFAAAAHPSYPLRENMRANTQHLRPLYGVMISRVSHIQKAGEDTARALSPCRPPFTRALFYSKILSYYSPKNSRISR